MCGCRRGRLRDQRGADFRRGIGDIGDDGGAARGCIGCHEHRGSAPPGGYQPLAMRPPPRVIAPYEDVPDLFDFPRDPSEYVRRVGRTARGALGTGEVSVLVLGRQVRLAREIMRRNTRGDPVEATPQF